MKGTNHKDDCNKVVEEDEENNENKVVAATGPAKARAVVEDSEEDNVHCPAAIKSKSSSSELASSGIATTPSANVGESSLTLTLNQETVGTMVPTQVRKVETEEVETCSMMQDHDHAEMLPRQPQQEVLSEQQEEVHLNKTRVRATTHDSRSDETTTVATRIHDSTIEASPPDRETASSMMIVRRQMQSKEKIRQEHVVLSRMLHNESSSPEEGEEEGIVAASSNSNTGCSEKAARDIETGIMMEKGESTSTLSLPLPPTSLGRRTSRTSIPGAFAMPSMGFLPIGALTHAAAGTAALQEHGDNVVTRSSPLAAPFSSSSRPEPDETSNVLFAVNAEVVNEQDEINRQKELEALRKIRQNLETEQVRQTDRNRDELCTSWSDGIDKSTVHIEIDAAEEQEIRPAHKIVSQRRFICYLGVLILLIVCVAVGVTLGGSTADDSGQNSERCFVNRQELLEAVDAYLLDRGFDTVVAQTYGLPINSWCVSKVTNFSGLFWDERNPKAGGYFDQLYDWDMSSAIDLNHMLSGSNFDGPLGEWDVSRVTDMSYLFADATKFNVGRSESLVWNVSAVNDMSFMFHGASSFNKDLSSWDVSQVDDFSAMFSGAQAFNRNLCAWGKVLSNEASVSGMFADTACLLTIDPDLSANPPGPFCHPCN